MVWSPSKICAIEPSGKVFVINSDLQSYFAKLLETSKLDCKPETQAYISTVLSRHGDYIDLLSRSVTLAWAEAKDSAQFAKHQTLGDYIFWSKSVACLTSQITDVKQSKQETNDADKQYKIAVGRNAYYACYRLIGKRWPLFEELSDRFDELSSNVSTIISK